jgi:asparagine synthase (glutamine-hydrolysing)
MIDHFWGRYVAFIHDPATDRKWVVRDPSSQLPCYRTQYDGVTVFFSHIADCLSLGLRFTVNWKYATSRLALGLGRADESGLNEVKELYGGSCTEFARDGRDRTMFYWDPVAIADSKPIEDSNQAMSAVRGAVISCAETWGGYYPNILHQLSGGIDSSIVLSCLARRATKAGLAAITYFMPGGFSDERPYARPVAERAGCEHLEISRNPAEIDLADICNLPPTVNADLLLSYLEILPIEEHLVATRGITAISTGMGGDTNFGSTSRSEMAKDFAQLHGCRTELMRLIVQVASCMNMSIWQVLNETIREGLLKRPTGDFLKQQQLSFRKLRSPKVVQTALDEPSCPHPWFRNLKGVRPGVAKLLLSFSFSWDFYNPLRPIEDPWPEPLHVLNSQPIAELALRIPSYLFNERDLNRGLVRRAFANELPRQVLRRQWKDRGVGFYEAAFRRNVAFVREYLLDGLLIENCLLDRVRVEAVLKSLLVKTDLGSDVGEIYDYLTVECWLRTWIGEHRRAAAA